MWTSKQAIKGKLANHWSGTQGFRTFDVAFKQCKV